MTDTVTFRLSTWRQDFNFDRAVNIALGLLLVALVITLGFSLAGINPWLTWTPRSLEREPGIDVFFAVLYTAITLLYVQNLVFFYQTREWLYLTYCLYIMAIGVHILFYEQILTAFGVAVPPLWGLVAGLTAIWFAYVFIFRFARQLLNVDETAPLSDRILKIGIGFTLVPPLFAFAGSSFFYIWTEFVWITVFGTALIVITGQSARQGNTAALIFCLSFVMQWVGYFWGQLIFMWPATFSALIPYYSDDPVKAFSAIYISSLVLEAMLMSIAAHLHVRETRSMATEAVTKAERLEQAVRAAKAHIADRARVDSQHEGQRNTPDASGVAQALRTIIVNNAAESFLDVSFLVRAMATSEATLARRLKEETGLTPNIFIRQVRLDFARDLLTKNDVRTVSEAAAASGFSSLSHFARHYRNAYGEPPADSLKSTPPDA